VSTGASGDGGAAPGGGGPARRPRRVVVSSVTGEPIDWDAEDDATAAPSRGERRKVLPDRLAEDAPEPGADESNDARLSRDVPPHWGR
jgi:hypothetical protein